MPRKARTTISDFPHHVTQRGNRNQKTFFSDQDRAYYLDLVTRQQRVNPVKIWAYCLMTNHVHFVAVPGPGADLSRFFAEVHKKYTASIHKRNRWSGYLWQGRFFSCVLDDPHVHAAVRYVENNPVAAGIVDRPEDYYWSSARARIHGIKDSVLSHFYLVDEVPNWRKYLREPEDGRADELEKCVRVGRPCGDGLFVHELQKITGKKLFVGSKGRPSKK